MIRSAIIILCVNCGAFLFSQELEFSRDFESAKKNFPLAIINNHNSYFHVLRSNRAIHDFTIERRSRINSERIAFTPLKLESVNSSWFDYENLDYVLHEYDHTLYFIFEKVLNTKKEIYLKTIDTNGKASDFKLLATLEMDKSMESIRIEFKIVEKNKLLLVLCQNYLNGSVKKTVELFYLPAKEKIWQKKLPLENALTGYSTSFACNSKGDLFYALFRSELEYYKRMYMDHRQLEVPVYIYSSLDIVSFNHSNSSITKKTLTVTGINGIFHLILKPEDSTVSLFLHFAKGEDPKSEKVFFITQQWSTDLSQEMYFHSYPLSEKIDKQLSYYDGTDYKTAADKLFAPLPSFYQHEGDYVVSEHLSGNYKKELLLLKWDSKDGMVSQQQLIPRKANVNDERARVKNISRVNTYERSNGYYLMLMESRSNAKLDSNQYKHKKFKRLGTIYNANLILFYLNPYGQLSKKLIYENNDFDYLPIQYTSNKEEFILFLDGSKFEKFATLIHK
jgi:hypothetical protein